MCPAGTDGPNLMLPDRGFLEARGLCDKSRLDQLFPCN